MFHVALATYFFLTKFQRIYWGLSGYFTCDASSHVSFTWAIPPVRPGHPATHRALNDVLQEIDCMMNLSMGFQPEVSAILLSDMDLKWFPYSFRCWDIARLFKYGDFVISTLVANFLYYQHIEAFPIIPETLFDTDYFEDIDLNVEITLKHILQHWMVWQYRGVVYRWKNPVSFVEKNSYGAVSPLSEWWQCW